MIFRNFFFGVNFLSLRSSKSAIKLKPTREDPASLSVVVVVLVVVVVVVVAVGVVLDAVVTTKVPPSCNSDGGSVICSTTLIVFTKVARACLAAETPLDTS